MKQLKLDAAWCKGCGICAGFCPKGVLKVVHGKIATVPETECVGCGICESLCPDYAIWLEEEVESVG